MTNSRFNNPSVRTTRSRSNSVSSDTSNAKEQVSAQALQSASIITSNHFQAETSNSTDISLALVRSFRVTGITNTLVSFKNESF